MCVSSCTAINPDRAEDRRAQIRGWEKKESRRQRNFHGPKYCALSVTCCPGDLRPNYLTPCMDPASSAARWKLSSVLLSTAPTRSPSDKKKTSRTQPNPAIMDAATIEEMNKIRVAQGMKPLPVPGAEPDPVESQSDDGEEAPSTVETRQAQSYDNYNKAMEAEAAKRKREEKAAAVRKAREQAQRFAKLEGEGLGEGTDGGEMDAKAWLMGQKKRQKKIEKARKLEEELAAAEAAAAASVQYTAKDLAGIKVAHETSSFMDGDDQVLTLKDTAIGDDEDGDELENINLREQEKLQERLDLKKRRPGYDPNDDDVNGGILAQYDEEISGKPNKKFTLDIGGSFGDLADILGKPTDKTEKAQNVSLDDIVGKSASSRVPGFFKSLP